MCHRPTTDAAGDTGTRAARPRWLNRTVAGAGLTSALGDLCYETTTVVLPGFLAVLGIPAAVLGLIEGVADATASFTRMIAGHIADRFGRRKELVLLGYGLTPLGQALIALAAGWPLILAGRMVAWFGKGLRGPLRDAIVLQAVDPATRGRAFGFHRAADTVGAVLGPLLGVALLGVAGHWTWQDPAGPFRLVLWVSLLPGMLAVLAFLVLVRDPRTGPNPALAFVASLRGLSGRFRAYLRAIAVFGSGDFSHTLLILAATALLTPAMGVVPAAQAAGLLYMLRNGVQALASWPVGRLADQAGRLPVLRAGYLLGAATAALTAVAFSLDTVNMTLLALIFGTAGLYTAVQEVLESPVAADMVGTGTLTTSLGVLGGVNGITRLVSSGLVGAIWTAVSPLAAFALAAGLMLAGTFALARLPER